MIFFEKIQGSLDKNNFTRFYKVLLGFRRKQAAMTLCKSNVSAIQWFHIHDRITFATILKQTVYLSSARVSISPVVVPRLIGKHTPCKLSFVYTSQVILTVRTESEFG